jgi:hypothetical protein
MATNPIHAIDFGDAYLTSNSDFLKQRSGSFVLDDFEIAEKPVLTSCTTAVLLVDVEEELKLLAETLLGLTEECPLVNDYKGFLRFKRDFNMLKRNYDLLDEYLAENAIRADYSWSMNLINSGISDLNQDFYGLRRKIESQQVIKTSALTYTFNIYRNNYDRVIRKLDEEIQITINNRALNYNFKVTKLDSLYLERKKYLNVVKSSFDVAREAIMMNFVFEKVGNLDKDRNDAYWKLSSLEVLEGGSRDRGSIWVSGISSSIKLEEKMSTGEIILVVDQQGIDPQNETGVRLEFPLYISIVKDKEGNQKINISAENLHCLDLLTNQNKRNSNDFYWTDIEEAIPDLILKMEKKLSE